MKYRVRRHTVVQPEGQSIKLIPLTKGENAIVDAEDFERLNQYNWHTIKNHSGGGRFSLYAARRIGKKGEYVLMHDQIMQPYDGEIDHCNHNGLDNRKENLRPCDHSQNIANTRPRPSKSCFKGVWFDAKRNKFTAYAGKNGKGRHLGYFNTAVGAARAHDAAAREMFGEFAYQNFNS